VNRTLVDGDPRQARDHDEDQDDLNEQRDVAQCLDEHAARAVHDPVTRQPPDPDQHAQDRCQRDPGDGETDGVDHAGPQRPAAGGGIRIDPRAEITAQRSAQKVVPGGDVSFFEVVLGLRGQEEQAQQHQNEPDYLREPLDHRGVAVEGRARAQGAQRRRFPRAPLIAHRGSPYAKHGAASRLMACGASALRFAATCDQTDRPRQGKRATAPDPAGSGAVRSFAAVG